MTGDDVAMCTFSSFISYSQINFDIPFKQSFIDQNTNHSFIEQVLFTYGVIVMLETKLDDCSKFTTEGIFRIIIIAKNCIVMYMQNNEPCLAMCCVMH